ncbi:M20/M25/M40 family metallo-hydrolase [Sphingomonas lacunae]|uniref:M20/M25/M40 family metallo-hydrolase n=2 Tax=Sphingomonas lacunae TaxID=2698828 RepID=A0A6M4AZ88_9SPHN|nr:M20/M25/M40 family metallo-hydrolase [Sphingomonas lacunae]
MASPVLAQQQPAISAEAISADTRTLADDSFLGRAPGTAGEQLTIDWLVQRLQSLGLEPAGPDGSWTQVVPLVRTQLVDGNLSIVTRAGERQLARPDDIYVSTVHPVDHLRIDQAPIIFVGHGVTAPEQDWDDFKGVDVRGKVVVFLVNDPDFSAAEGEDAFGRFGGTRMTYYGRWTYKFEEAARRGAIAALIVHDTPGAGYGWDTVKAPAGENYDIVRPKPNDRVLLQGWLSGQAAVDLFAASGLDLDVMRRAARSRAFQPVELTGQRFSAQMSVAQSRVESRNVLARIAGATRPGEVVIYGAHWDAYGVGAPAEDGTTVRAGANDDALGVAGLLEIARLIKAGPPLARTVAFGFWTAEERGLLGSEYFAASAVIPSETIVANVTLDIMNTGGPSRDVMLVGHGQNELEQDLARAAAAQGRRVTPETLPERGLFYRADHFPLARRGVPTLLFMQISGAPDLVEGGREAGEAWLAGYMRCYHQTCDRWTPDLDWRGVEQDVALAYTVGTGIANSDRWPEWSPTSEFARLRPPR